MMTDDDFNSLAARYLEDAVDESRMRQLNRELLDSPERVRQFNDLRMLAGMILEHGRSEIDLPKAVDFPELEPNHRRRGQWLSAAALLMAGLLAGLLLSSPWKNRRDTDSDPAAGAIVAVGLIDGGFEQPDPGIATGYPEQAGHWVGDAVEIVPNPNTEIRPWEGKSMLCLANIAPAPEPFAGPSQRAVQWQIVDLSGAAPLKSPALATLRARFNRDREVLEPELSCRVELYTFRGSPETAESQLESESYLAVAVTNLQTDSDPGTWEIAETSLQVSPDADFLLLGISGFAERLPQPFGGEAYAGHYADGVELKLINSKSNIGINNDQP